MGFGVLVNKMTLFVTIVISNLTQVFVIPSRQPVTIVSSEKASYIDLRGCDAAWRFWAARAIITIVFSIALIIFIVFLRPVRSFDVFEVLKRLGFRLLRPRKVLDENFFFDIFVYLGKRSMALWTVNIYFWDLE